MCGPYARRISACATEFDSLSQSWHMICNISLMDKVDRLSRLPLELKLQIWEILNNSIKADSSLNRKEERKCYFKMMLLNKEWYHSFASEVYNNEVQVSKVLSNNLKDKSKTNIKRIEELYTSYMTAVNCVGRSYHRSYRIFWESLDAFNYEIQFPNLKTLYINTRGTQLSKAPLIRLIRDIEILEFCQGKEAAKYSVLEEFCDHIRRSGISIGKVVFWRSKVLAACKSILECNIDCIVYGGLVRTKDLDLLATNESCTSLTLTEFGDQKTISPRCKTLYQRLSFLNQFGLMVLNKNFQLSKLHLLRIKIAPKDAIQLVRHISDNCPNLTQLDVMLCNFGTPTSLDQGAHLAQAFNYLDDNSSNKLKKLAVEITHGHPVILERFLSNTDWSRYANMTSIGLRFIGWGDRYNFIETIKARIPNIEEVIVNGLKLRN